MTGMLKSCVGLLVAAFLDPLPRTVGFVSIGGYILLQHWHIVDASLIAQCVLYVSGAICFVRCAGEGGCSTVLIWALMWAVLCHQCVGCSCVCLVIVDLLLWLHEHKRFGKQQQKRLSSLHLVSKMM